jgi:hypothetical protein
MNERIRQLAEQAGIGYGNLSTGHGDNWQFAGRPEELERFAQLIVRECADLYNHEDVLAPIGMSAHGEAHQHGWIEGTKTYRDTILEHFGVEE